MTRGMARTKTPSTIFNPTRTGRQTTEEAYEMRCCSHLFEINNVTPKTPNGCEECLKIGDPWVHLRLCQTNCGLNHGRTASSHEFIYRIRYRVKNKSHLCVRSLLIITGHH